MRYEFTSHNFFFLNSKFFEKKSKIKKQILRAANVYLTIASYKIVTTSLKLTILVFFPLILSLYLGILTAVKSLFYTIFICNFFFLRILNLI